MTTPSSGCGWGLEHGRWWPRPAEAAAGEAQALCQRALEISKRLQAELWLSSTLGAWWAESEGLGWDPEEEHTDVYFLVAGPVIREVAAVGGAGAWAVLHGVSRFDTGRAARLAGDLADTLEAPELDRPDWTTHLGERYPVREWSQRRPSGHEVIAIELRHVLDEPRWLTIFTGGWSGRTRIETCRSFDEVEDFARAVARKNAKVLPFEQLLSGQGCRRAQQVLRDGHNYRTDGDRFVELRAWALAMTKPRITDRERRDHQERLTRWMPDYRPWDQSA